MLHDFPFTIREVAELCGLGIGLERYPNRVSIDINCPFCGGKKKMNLNLKKDVFGCNRCGIKGGMLALYSETFGVDSQTAYAEILAKLGKKTIREPGSSCNAPEDIRTERDQEQGVTDRIKDKAYSSLLSMLPLSDTHKGKLLERGLTQEQIERNGYRSTPVFGFRRIAERILESGCRVEGVPGFHVDPEGRWTIHFSQKSSGILIPIRNTQDLITGMQIRRQKICLALQCEFSKRNIFGKPCASGRKSRRQGSVYHGRRVKGRHCPCRFRENLRLCSGGESVCKPGVFFTEDERAGKPADI